MTVVRHRLTQEDSPFGMWELWVFAPLTIAIHVIALAMLYFGLRSYEALLLVTTLDSFNILVGALSGSFVLQALEIR